MKTQSARNWVVVVDVYEGPVYLGRLDGPTAQECGVRSIFNANRYTRIGAARVLRGFPSAMATGRAYVQHIND